MNKYKICVYAICKNEEKFIDRWYESIKDADKIFVLDTGSTDNSVQKLKTKEKIIFKQQKIDPWRFDVARNMSLELVDEDTDICICLDLDEIIQDGWRDKIEKNWDENTNRLSYTYNWKLDENNNPIVSFYIEKIHSRKDYEWVHPVHEVLKYNGEYEKKKIVNDLVINHYPDNKKSRGSYLPLLELSVKENPNDDRNMHYLGREYMYYGKWNECIDTLIKHLNLKSSLWKDERCASMRFISRSYKAMKRYDEAKMWLEKAINEAPYLRDPYIEMAILCYELNEWDSVIEYTNRALDIKTHQKTYINETFSWDNTPYDLLSIAYFNKKDFENSVKNVDIALKMDPTNERLIKNKEIINQFI